MNMTDMEEKLPAQIFRELPLEKRQKVLTNVMEEVISHFQESNGSKEWIEYLRSLPEEEREIAFLEGMKMLYSESMKEKSSVDENEPRKGL